MERRAGPQQLRLVDHRRALPGHEPAGHHRRHLPHRADPPGDRRPGSRHERGSARGSLHPRGRQRGGAQRAHPRRPLARGRRAPGDARRSRRRHPHAVAGRPAEPPRTPLHRRERARLRPPDEPPPILVSGFGPKAIKLAARIGDGYCTTTPDKEAIELYRSEGGTGPVHAGTKVCFMADEDEARGPRTGCGPTRRCRANWPRCCPHPRTSSRHASSSSPRCW